MNEITTKLQQMNTEWQNTQPQGTSDNSQELPPDGNYTAKVNGCKPVETKKGRLMLVTELVVVGGAQAGWAFAIWHALDRVESLGWTKGHLQNLGVELDDLTLLQDKLEKIIGAHVEVDVVTNTNATNANGSPYRNAYVRGLVGKPLSDQFAAPAVSDDTADIPF